MKGVLNMKVSELKMLLGACPNDMDVIIPVSDESAIDSINHVYSVSTAAIIQQSGDKALLLNSSTDDNDIQDQLNKYNPLNLQCEKILY